MQNLIEKVKQWGIDKGITGPYGKGTRYAQAEKMLEEAKETHYAVKTHNYPEIKDGIGDTIVTLILLAELHNLTLEECLQEAYNVISKRNGKMVDGQFIKDKS